MATSNADLLELRARLKRIIKTITWVQKRQSGKTAAQIAEPILIASLQNGLNITQACLQAGISREAYYAECKVSQAFSDRMAKAEQFGTMKARQNIQKAIRAEDLDTSKWYLERKDPEFKPKKDIMSGDQPLKTALVEFVGDDGTKPDQD